MKKVGILTLYESNYNYGGILQAYALRKKIENLGYDCKVISYNSSYNPIYPNAFFQLKQYSFFDACKKISEKIKVKIGNKKFYKLYYKRIDKIKKFKNEMIPHTEKYNDEMLKTICSNFDYIISGSDQVWNPNCGRLGYLQMFGHGGIKKISYAASISRNALTKRDEEVMIPAISDFDYISVREETAKNLLKDKIDKEINVTIDPTLLLNKAEWEEISEDLNIDGEYVLCYFFSNSINYRKKIFEYCSENNLKMVYIPFAKQEYNDSDLKGIGEKIEFASPNNFIALFKNAKYVFTDSFHGTVFSILFEKNFITLLREKNNNVSMNSRLIDLLTKLKLENKIFSEINLDSVKEIESKIDYLEVENLLEIYRRKSLEFLENSLK